MVKCCKSALKLCVVFKASLFGFFVVINSYEQNQIHLMSLKFKEPLKEKNSGLNMNLILILKNSLKTHFGCNFINNGFAYD